MIYQKGCNFFFSLVKKNPEQIISLTTPPFKGEIKITSCCHSAYATKNIIKIKRPKKKTPALFVANIYRQTITAGSNSRQYIIHDQGKTTAMNLDFPMGFPVGIFHYLGSSISKPNCSCIPEQIMLPPRANKIIIIIKKESVMHIIQLCEG